MCGESQNSGSSGVPTNQHLYIASVMFDVNSKVASVEVVVLSGPLVTQTSGPEQQRGSSFPPPHP